MSRAIVLVEASRFSIVGPVHSTVAHRCHRIRWLSRLRLFVRPAIWYACIDALVYFKRLAFVWYFAPPTVPRSLTVWRLSIMQSPVVLVELITFVPLFSHLLLYGFSYFSETPH